MNALDRIISYFSPGTALARERQRVALDAVRSYDAAAKGRRNDNWKATGADANVEVSYALSSLRNRSRELVRNNPYARRIVQAIPANVVGTGIVPAPLGMTPNSSKRLMAAWNAWAGTTACDFDGQMTFYGLQRLIQRVVCESGECIVLRQRTSDTANPIKLQVLEPDFIDTTKSTQLMEGGGRIIQGVEFNERGQRVAYYIYSAHPGSGEMRSLVSNRIPAEDVAHIYYAERPGQVRGVPWLAPVMIRLRDFDEYEDAELVRQKIAACFTVFVQDADPASIENSSKEMELASRVEPGIIEMLPPGKQVSFAQPPTTNGYDVYSRKILQGIASGVGITYEVMTGDLSNVNFSSGRMGWLEFQRNISDWQYNMLVPMLCDRVWSWFLQAMAINGKAKPGIAASWTPPRREMIDPVKETQALALMVRNGFGSYSEALRSLGYDPDDTIAEIAADFEKLDTNGVMLDSDPRRGGKGQPAESETPPGENQPQQ